jgi:hypothetical protein
MKRLDHSMIFIFIAGQLHAVRPAGTAVTEGHGAVLDRLGRRAGRGGPEDAVAVGAALARVPLYILLGWVAAWFIGPIMHGAGVAAVLLIVGGALYSIGGVLYALKWPNPWPTTFGHHEFFHACTACRGDLPLHRDVVRRLLRAASRQTRTMGRIRASLLGIRAGDVVRAPVGLHRGDLAVGIERHDLDGLDAHGAGR